MIRLILAAGAALLPLAAAAQHAAEPVVTAQQGALTITDAHARGANAMAGAAFMTIANAGPTDCVLAAATSPAALRVEMHTHREVEGVMQMRRVEAGFGIPAGGSHALARGGDHLMLLGLTAPFEDGMQVPVTLDFGDCGMIEAIIPVDNARMPAADHGPHGAVKAPSH